MLPTLVTRVMNDKLVGGRKTPSIEYSCIICPGQVYNSILPFQFEEFADNLKDALTDANQSQSDAIESIVKAIELSKTREMFTVYKSFNAFLVDVQWILNNYMNIFAGKLHVCFVFLLYRHYSAKLIISIASDDYEKRSTAEELKELLEDEIDGLKKCGECYSNANYHPNEWFTMVCDEPHIIAWAKFQGCNYWPVKVMSVNGRILSVRFFGDHTHSDVAASKCFLYSKESPVKSAKARGALYKAAINVSLHFGSTFENTVRESNFVHIV